MQHGAIKVGKYTGKNVVIPEYIRGYAGICVTERIASILDDDINSPVSLASFPSLYSTRAGDTTNMLPVL